MRKIIFSVIMLAAINVFAGDMRSLAKDVGNNDLCDQTVNFTNAKIKGVATQKNNWTATTAPGVNDDTTAGYGVGSLWVDATNGKCYICRDATTGAAQWIDLSSAGGVTSWNSRTGAVVPAINDYTWNQINKATSSIADITNRSHNDLTDIGTNTHPQIDAHIASTANPHNTDINQVAPTQTGNAGKFLGTNGTTATWTELPQSGHIIKSDGTPMTQRSGLNFGAGFVVADDSGNDETDIRPQKTSYKSIFDSSDSRWGGTSKITFTHGLEGSPDKTDISYQFNDISTGAEWNPDVDYTTSTATTLVFDFTDCPKPTTETLKVRLWTAGGMGSGNGTDTDALHKSTAGEIAGLTEKTVPTGNDVLMIEDKADSDSKKFSTIQNTVNNIQPQKALRNAQTGTSYTLVAGDAGYIVSMNNAAANALTIPTNASVAFATDTTITIAQLGAGTTTITASTGVTLNGVTAGSCTISAQWEPVSIMKIGTDAWWIFGAHSEVQ